MRISVSCLAKGLSHADKFSFTCWALEISSYCHQLNGGEWIFVCALQNTENKFNLKKSPSLVESNSNENCTQWGLWFKTLFLEKCFGWVFFQHFESHKWKSMYPNCTGVYADISEIDILKAEQIKTKLFVCSGVIWVNQIVKI